MNENIKNNIKIIIILFIVFLILYILHITLRDSFENQYDGPNNEGQINIIFTVDQISQTLTVEEIYAQGRTLYWSDIYVAEGFGSLPYGIISIGDIISDCTGHLVLKCRDTGIHIYSNVFN
jgi:hypothetical protein